MLSMMRRVYDKASEGSGPPRIEERRPQTPRRKMKIGLALGAGAARGWCHIGILQELEAAGIRPDVIAGSSIGAVVGGCYAAGKLGAIEEFSRSLTRRRILSMLDLSFSGGGLFGGARLKTHLETALAGQKIENLSIPFAAVATEIGSGHEIWLRKGSLSLAIRASYAMPGILEPVEIDQRWLFDGALVNPVPVSVCRALGADMVIAVSLVSDSMFRGTVIGDRQAGDQAVEAIAEQADTGAAPAWLSGIKHPGAMLRRNFGRQSNGAPGIASVMLDAFSITQDRIARSRLAGDPPDVLINARLDQFGLFDFHRAADMIALGRETVRRRLPDIEDHMRSLGEPLSMMAAG